MGSVKKDTDEGHILNFGLLIQKTQNRYGESLQVAAQNEGIPQAEIILVVEAWLDKVRSHFKEGISSSI